MINVFLIYKGCNALKGQEMDLNQSWAVGGNGFISGVNDPFGDPWTAPEPNSGPSGADFGLP